MPAIAGLDQGQLTKRPGGPGPSDDHLLIPLIAHRMKPPVIHGSVNNPNVLISLSKILSDVTVTAYDAIH